MTFGFSIEWRDRVMPAGMLRESPRSLRFADLVFTDRETDGRRVAKLRARRPNDVFSLARADFGFFPLECTGVEVDPPARSFVFCGIGSLFASMRGYSHDRLVFLGEEYVRRWLLPRPNAARVAQVKAQIARGETPVVVSGWLDHVVRPLARHLGVDRIVCNRLEFRDGRATGRLKDPIIPSRGRFLPPDANVRPAAETARRRPTIVVFEDDRILEPLSVRETLRGKELLLIGVTGFIGKVWLANVLKALPDLARVYCLVRRRGTTSAKARFERLLAESPVLPMIPQEVVTRKIEVVEGDMCEPGLGLDALTREIAPRTHRSRVAEAAIVLAALGGAAEGLAGGDDESASRRCGR